MSAGALRVPDLAFPLAVGLGVGVVALVGIALVGRYALNKAGGAFSDVAPLINPASDRNLIYDGVIGEFGRNVTGEKDWSLGTWIWEKTHPAETAREAEALKNPATGGGSGW